MMMRIIKSDDTQLYFYKYQIQKEAVIKACGLQTHGRNKKVG